MTRAGKDFGLWFAFFVFYYEGLGKFLMTEKHMTRPDFNILIIVRKERRGDRLYTLGCQGSSLFMVAALEMKIADVSEKGITGRSIDLLLCKLRM